MTAIQKTEIKIDSNDENERLDVFIRANLPDFSRSKIQKFIETNNILVNCLPAKNSYKLKENDVVTIDLQDNIFEILPENILLDIKYEDENMLVVNKPKNMLTHPTHKEFSGTLVNALLYLFSDNLSDLNGNLRPGIVHRLDRNTSGLIMIAKNNKTHSYLAEQIKEHKITKKYYAIVHGIVENDFGEINAPIGRNKKNPEKMAVLPEGKPSFTKYKVLERFKNNTFLELTLVTGRTHQIRVHLQSISHPVVNDTLYSKIPFPVKTTEQVLQSFSLTFTKPENNSIMSVSIEPDEDIQKVLRYLRSKQ